MAYKPPASRVQMAVSITKALDSIGIVVVPALFESSPDWMAFYTPNNPHVVASALVKLHFLKKPDVYEFEGENIDTGKKLPLPSGTYAIAFPVKKIYVPKMWIIQ